MELQEFTVEGVPSGEFPLYNWEVGENTPEITGLTAGDYDVTTISNGCILTETITVGLASDCALMLGFISTHETDTNANDGTTVCKCF